MHLCEAGRGASLAHRKGAYRMNRIFDELSKLNGPKRAGAILALSAAMAIALAGQTLTTLHSFDGADGQNPEGGLVQATNGDLYGTTLAGGANGQGTVFKITTTGTLTTLHGFDGT